VYIYDSNATSNLFYHYHKPYNFASLPFPVVPAKGHPPPEALVLSRGLPSLADLLTNCAKPVSSLCIPNSMSLAKAKAKSLKKSCWSAAYFSTHGFIFGSVTNAICLLADTQRAMGGAYIRGKHHKFGAGYCGLVLEWSIPFTWLPDIPQ